MGPHLTKSHKEARYRRARTQLSKKRFLWRQVILTDEKLFTLDGPDGRKHYWHDKRLEQRYFPKWQGGEGSVVILGAFSCRGTISLFCANKNIAENIFRASKFRNCLHDYRKHVRLLIREANPIGSIQRFHFLLWKPALLSCYLNHVHVSSLQCMRWCNRAHVSCYHANVGVIAYICIPAHPVIKLLTYNSCFCTHCNQNLRVY